jgi:exo-1,4-beta-D-glucosaminidase
VTVKNTSDKLALAIHLVVTRGKGGEEILPSYWGDNYFSLMPGEKRIVKVRFTFEDLGSDPPVITLDGWNL